MKITVDRIMGFEPFKWPRHEIIKAIGGESIDIIDFIELKTVNRDDKLWLLLRPEIIPEKELRLLACDFAESALYIWEKKNPRNNSRRQVIEISRKYAHGEATIEELSDVTSTIWDAYAMAWEAIEAVAWDAVPWHTSDDAERNSSRDAVRVALYGIFLGKIKTVLKQLEAISIR